MKYLSIFDLTDVTQQDDITEDDLTAFDEGILDIYRFHEGQFQQYAGKDDWVNIESRPCPT